MSYLLLASFMILVGCSKDPISTSQTNNQKIKVELLFNHNGCKVYRFMDDRVVYFSDCSQDFQTSHTESCGKKCTRTVTDQTVGL